MFQNSNDPRGTPGKISTLKDLLRGLRRHLRRSMRSAFTREQLVSSAKSLAWVAPLTILIWVYAEREQIRPSERQPIPFTVRTTDPRFIVTVLNPRERMIIAQLRGPQQAVEQVKRKLLPTETPDGAVLIVPAVVGEQDIPTRTIRDAVMFR